MADLEVKEAPGETGTQEIFDNSTITTPRSDNTNDDPFAELSAFVKLEAEAANKEAEGNGQKTETEKEVAADTKTEEESVESEETKAEAETETAEEEEGAETRETKAEAETEIAEEEETDAFAELEKGKTEFPDFKALREKYPRNASDAVLKETAEYAASARKYNEFVNDLGGEAFAEPVKKIASALRTGNSDSFFTGIHETGGSDGLISVIAGALDLAILRPQQFLDDKNNEAAVAFGKALTGVSEAAFKERFGSDLTMAKIERAVDLVRQGWVDKIDQWKESEEGIDFEEAEELLKIDNDPKLKAVLKEKARLEAELLERDTAGKANETLTRRALEAGFSIEAEKNITSAFESIIWRNSPLKERETDDADAAEVKRIMRSSIKQDAINAFHSSPEKASLQKDFGLGKSGTALWRSAFANAVNAAILRTKAANRSAEQVIVKLQGQTRNGKLASTLKAERGGGNGRTGSSADTTNPLKTAPPKAKGVSRTDDLSSPAAIERSLYEELRSVGL